MNKETTVIDLLNKMNNENYRPLQVKWRSKTYYYKAEYGHYYNNENDRFGLFAGYTIEGILNDTVEIIEEDNNKIEKDLHPYGAYPDEVLYDTVVKKVYEIIDKINNI